MLVIDKAKMPKTCGECFSSNQAQYGPLAGEYFCGVRFSNGEPLRRCIINLVKKPDWCPIKEIKQEEDK